MCLRKSVVIAIANEQECMDVAKLFQPLDDVNDVLCISALWISKTLEMGIKLN